MLEINFFLYFLKYIKTLKRFKKCLSHLAHHTFDSPNQKSSFKLFSAVCNKLSANTNILHSYILRIFFYILLQNTEKFKINETI